MGYAASDRIVERARLRVPHADALPGFRFLIEDALATASLPTGAGLILIRRLALGRIAHNAGRSDYARRVEQALRGAVSGAVHGSNAAEARLAEIVWFHDAVEAALVRLGQLASEQNEPAWFWARALPDVPAHDRPEVQAGALLVRLIEAEGGLAALARWVGRLSDLSFDHVLEILPRDADSKLRTSLKTIGVEVASIGRSEAASGLPLPFALARRAAGRGRRVPVWALRLIVAAELAASGRPPAGQPVAAIAEIILRSARRPAEVPGAEAGRAVGAAAVPPASPAGFAEPAPSPRRRPTRCGGLFMLVNLLAMLGFSEWLERRPEEDRPILARSMLARLGRLPRDDPHRPLLALSAAERRRARALVAADDVATWERRMRAFARKRLGLSIRAIVRRPAEITIGAADVAIFLPMGGIDLRLRRAGMDQDPGWVPWLGWIVRFHFVDGPP